VSGTPYSGPPVIVLVPVSVSPLLPEPLVSAVVLGPSVSGGRVVKSVVGTPYAASPWLSKVSLTPVVVPELLPVLDPLLDPDVLPPLLAPSVVLVVVSLPSLHDAIIMPASATPAARASSP